MNRYMTLLSALGLILLLSGEIAAGGPRGTASRGKIGSVFSGGAPRNNIQRFWKNPVHSAPRHGFHHHHRRPPAFFYPHYYYRHNPRSIIVITPSTYYPYQAPFTVVTSEPFYCHVHHVGFVSRVGFLDHISGTHKIPLETATSICTDGDESCVIEGY